MPFTFEDFDADISYSGDPIRRSPELEQFFTYSDACIDPQNELSGRQIYFRFHHNGACADVLLNPWLPSCITCFLNRYLSGLIPNEGNYLDEMITFAWMKATDAMLFAQPSVRAVYADVYLRTEAENRRRECRDMFQAVKSLKRKRMSPAVCLETCSICLDEFGTEQEALEMPCLHVFHGCCIKKWLKKKNSCPLCRFKLAADIPHTNADFD